MKSEKPCRGGLTNYEQILLTGKSRNIYQSVSWVYLLQKANISIPKHSHRSSGRHRKGDEKSLFTFTIFRNVSWLYLFIFFFKKKSSASLRGWGNKQAWGRGRGGVTSPLPLLFPDHPSLLSPSPGLNLIGRSDEIRFLERSEVIGREDCWREISIHYTPLYSKGKAKVRSCAPAEERSFGSLPYYY